MNVAFLKRALAHDADVIGALLADISPEQAQWKPDADTWSLLEIINHLYDEEREDFRAHLDQTLHGLPWSGIAPFEWITERRYNERDLAASLQAFLTERRASLAWLDSLAAPNWDAFIALHFGDLRAGDVFVSWVAHDQWHIQQLAQRRLDYTLTQIAPYDAEYSGALEE
ncbi:MAG TPA: DinB family protein [Anaerolineae bacterium]|nr:DinB family protein [Anaerolineae bacterium]